MGWGNVVSRARQKAESGGPHAAKRAEIGPPDSAFWLSLLYA